MADLTFRFGKGPIHTGKIVKQWESRAVSAGGTYYDVLDETGQTTYGVHESQVCEDE